jgi:prophage regulatory protein
MTEQSLRMIRLPQVMELTGMKETFIREAIKKGDFPQNIEMGMRCRAWIEAEVMQWIQDRIENQRKIIALREGKAKRKIKKVK